jgi:hypothetical protein
MVSSLPLAVAEPHQSLLNGIYAVHIVTQHVSCHKTYTTKIAVRGDPVHATGHGLIRGSGHIAGDRALVPLHKGL